MAEPAGRDRSGPPSGSESGSQCASQSILLSSREVLNGANNRGKSVVRQQDFARKRRDFGAPTLRKRAARGTRSWTWLGPFSKSVLIGVVRSSPGTLLWPLAVMAICTSLGLFGLFAASEDTVHVERGIATELATDAARRIELQIQQAFTPTIAMEAFIQRNPLFQALARDFTSIASQLLARVGNESISNLQLAPNLVVQAVAPLAGNERAMGLDLLVGDPIRVADVMWTIKSRNLTVAGPYKLIQGGYGVIIRQPVFVHNVSQNETFGANVSSQACPDCWDAANRTKLWGFAQGMARLDGLLQGSDNRLRSLQKYGPWHISRLLPDGRETIIASHSPNGTCNGHDCIQVDIQLPNARWRLYLSKQGDWAPHWQGLVALVVVGSFLLALLLFCLLVAAQRHRALLMAMFPPQVLTPLQQGKNFSEEFDSVTILFSDIVSYTTISSALQPIEVAQMLNELYCEFDDLVDKNGCYKIETIGDAFMAVGGCPVAEPPEMAAERVAMMALDMVQRAANFQSSAGHRLRIRVGLASGPVAAAVIGRKMPRYCLFGDTVNLASRMESTSEPMRIQVSASTAHLLQQCASATSLVLISRGPVQVKGKGNMECYWLEAVAAAEPQDMPAPAAEPALARFYRAASALVKLKRPQPPAPSAEVAPVVVGSVPCRACAGGGDSRRTQGTQHLSRFGDGGVSHPLCTCGSAVLTTELRWTTRHLPNMYDSSRSSLPGLPPAAVGNVGGRGGSGSSPQLPLPAAIMGSDQASRDNVRSWHEILTMRSSRLSSTGGVVRSGSILRSLLRVGPMMQGQGLSAGAPDGVATISGVTAPSLTSGSRQDFNQPARSAQSLSRYELRRGLRPPLSATATSTAPVTAVVEPAQTVTAPSPFPSPLEGGGSPPPVVAVVPSSALAAMLRGRADPMTATGPGLLTEVLPVTSPSVQLELAGLSSGPAGSPARVLCHPHPRLSQSLAGAD